MRPNDGCYWTQAAPPPMGRSLQGEIEADVAIVGCGIVGAVAARLLTDRGRRVVVLDSGRVGRGVTGRSTAKVTAQHGLTLSRIEDRHGSEAARLYAAANREGVALIGELARRHRLACDLEPADSVVYATTAAGRDKLEKEQASAARAGLAMELVDEAGLPFATTGALRLAAQAQFQPVAFVEGLAASLPEGSVFEESCAIEWSEDEVRTARGRVRAGRAIMATHLPLGQVGHFHAHTHPRMHAIMAVPVEEARAPAGMFIGADEPRRSLRRHRDAEGRTFLILTGPRFEHGDGDAEMRGFAELEAFAREHFGYAGGGWRWSNEDYAPRDGLPYVGWAGAERDSLLVATGFDAWGLSNGAFAGRLLADLVEGRPNEFAELFDASRHSLKGLGRLVADTGKTVANLVGRHAKKHPDMLPPLADGDAAMVEIAGRVCGVHRDGSGALHVVSAVCTHMGCLLGWNPVDRTWDCPCHGSRFGVRGQVLHGPAVEPLEQVVGIGE
jgi:glycine/D-amino acid oxidase-like deaminating enzyme/nitrite reductase/ring-hydroxylating ferredoxin subunit